MAVSISKLTGHSKLGGHLRVKLLLLLALLGFFISSCSTANLPKELDPPSPSTVSPTVITPPGAAPNFQASLPAGFNFLAALKTVEFWKLTFGLSRSFIPNQAGFFILGLVVTLLVAFNFSQVKTWRNFDVLFLILPSIFIFNLITLGDRPFLLRDPARRALFTLLFSGLFLTSVVLFVRAIFNALAKKSIPWLPNISNQILIGLLIFFIFTNTLITIAKPPDDAGIYTNIGAYKMLSTGKFPYTDPELQGGAAATYGPALYIAHMPFQVILAPIVNSQLGNNELVRRLVIGNNDPTSNAPPIMATKLASLFFQYLAILCLVLIGRSLANPSVGWGLAVLYAGSAYVHGIGGEDHVITGLRFISHIAPVGLTLLAFYLLKKPILSGAALALAGSILYYPFFFLPLWVGYYFWQRKEKPLEWLKFLSGFVVVLVIILILVGSFTTPVTGDNKWRVIYESTVGHQEGESAYGSSTFSFWGLQPGLDAFWQRPFISDIYLLRPSFILFFMYLALSFFLVRRRTIPQLAFLTASIAIAVQLWKSHAGGTYVEWYYPFLLIGLFAQSPQPGIEPEAEFQGITPAQAS